MQKAVVQRFSVKKLLLNILLNSQENTCSRVSFLIKLQTLGLNLNATFESLKSLKFPMRAAVGNSDTKHFYSNTLSFQTPVVAASKIRTKELGIKNFSFDLLIYLWTF